MLLVGTGAAAAAYAGASVEFTPAALQLVKNAKTFHVEVDQHYVDSPDTQLPFAETVTVLLQYSGLTAAPAETADVNIKVNVDGRALTRSYTDLAQGVAVKHYSGADVSGWYDLKAPDGRKAQVDFTSRREPPLNITQTYEDPRMAPYAGAFGGFVENFTKIVALTRGAQPLIAVLRAQDSEDFFYTVPQLQYCAASELGHLGGPEAKTVLLEALQSFAPHRQAGAARGLRIMGDTAALPALIAALTTVEGDVPEALDADGRWQTITHIDHAFDASETDAGFLEPWPEILSAIQSLPSPDKTARLLMALRHQDSALSRIGAALILGRGQDAKACDPLLETAKSDTHLLVRTAAINALGELRDQRALTMLRTLARNGQDGPEKLAARRALERLAADAGAASALAGNTPP